MDTLDPAGEWLRLSEHYRHMSDGELVVLARQASGLTDAARQILSQEISRRRLELPPEDPPAAPDPEPDPDSPYAEERGLVEICTVWSLRDGLQVQTLLDSAGVPFFMGAEKATGVDAVTSNFAEGVGVRIMRIGIPYAQQAMQWYEPADEPPAAKEKEADSIAIRCPKCRSAEVTFEDLVGQSVGGSDESSAKFQWVCDSCGCEWEDEGIVTEG